MRTVGVDLSSQDRDTAVCVVDWEQQPRIAALEIGVGNDALVERLRGGDPAGIDAPFGWPARFVAAVAGWNEAGVWPGPWDRGTQRELRLRETDRWIAAEIGKWPLSVSADSIAMCAMRTATVLHALGPVDRVRGPRFEAYPAAALLRWGIPSVGYKRDSAVRGRVLAALGIDPDGEHERLVASDHALDALLCALIARAAALGETHPPPPELDAAVIAREGWIHLPRAGSLARLAAPA